MSLGWVCQLFPPSPVCRIVPFHPTAQPNCCVAKVTDDRGSVAPMAWVCQLFPPFSVCQIPLHPVAQPDWGVEKVTDDRAPLAPQFWTCQLLPPFSVCRIVRALPNSSPDRC